MPILTISLVLLSALMHAGWNFMAKSEGASAAFFAIAMTASAIFMLPLYLYYVPALSLITPVFWGIFMVAGLFNALYCISMAAAYRLHDISFVYPLARALPVMMVALICLAIGYGKPLSPLAFTGLAVTAVGCLVLPLRSIQPAFLKQYWHRSLLFVLLAAVGTTGYTIIDSMGLKQLEKTIPHFSKVDAALFYLAYQTLCTLFFLVPYVWFSRVEKHHFKTLVRHSLNLPVWAGIIFKLSYVLILFAMQLTTNVSYIVAFRQSSILFSFLLGVLFLHEKTTAFKNLGVALIFVGLVMVTVM